MKRLVLLAAALLTAALIVTEAWAACPPGTHETGCTTQGNQRVCTCRANPK